MAKKETSKPAKSDTLPVKQTFSVKLKDKIVSVEAESAQEATDKAKGVKND